MVFAGIEKKGNASLSWSNWIIDWGATMGRRLTGAGYIAVIVVSLLVISDVQVEIAHRR